MDNIDSKITQESGPLFSGPKFHVSVNGKKWHEDVLAFHKAFNHPVGQTTRDRLLNRIHWMHEELIEFATHRDLVDEVDALIDFLYFTIGFGVELGMQVLEDEENVSAMLTHKGHSVVEEAQLSISKDEMLLQLLAALKLLTEVVVKYIPEEGAVSLKSLSEDAVHDLHRSSHILAEAACLELTRHAIDPNPFWDIVQQANMAKLWPDGKPHYRKDGKVIKPKKWQAPEPQMKQLLDELF